MPDPSYSLRPMTAADLVLLAEWLRGPEHIRWWGDPAEWLASKTEDLDEPLMDLRIAYFGADPIGYLQSYPVHAWSEGAPNLVDQPPGSMAIDCFVAPQIIGQGHGSAMVRLYALSLLANGAPAVLIDPDPSNERAVRAYRRAGFRDLGLRPDGEGDMTLVMRFDPASRPTDIDMAARGNAPSGGPPERRP